MKFKKLLTVTLVVALVMGVSPAAFAQDEWEQLQMDQVSKVFSRLKEKQVSTPLPERTTQSQGWLWTAQPENRQVSPSLPTRAQARQQQVSTSLPERTTQSQEWLWTAQPESRQVSPPLPTRGQARQQEQVADQPWGASSRIAGAFLNQQQASTSLPTRGQARQQQRSTTLPVKNQQLAPVDMNTPDDPDRIKNRGTRHSWVADTIEGLESLILMRAPDWDSSGPDPERQQMIKAWKNQQAAPPGQQAAPPGQKADSSTSSTEKQVETQVQSPPIPYWVGQGEPGPTPPPRPTSTKKVPMPPILNTEKKKPKYRITNLMNNRNRLKTAYHKHIKDDPDFKDRFNNLLSEFQWSGRIDQGRGSHSLQGLPGVTELRAAGRNGEVRVYIKKDNRPNAASEDYLLLGVSGKNDQEAIIEYLKRNIQNMEQGNEEKYEDEGDRQGTSGYCENRSQSCGKASGKKKEDHHRSKQSIS